MAARKTIGFAGMGHVSGHSEVSLLSPGGTGTGTGTYLPAGVPWGTQGWARVLYSGLANGVALPGGGTGFPENGIVSGTRFVQCNQPFPVAGNFAIGETLTTPGGWSATLVALDTKLRRLYVSSPTGTLNASDVITGGTSGATAGAAGAVLQVRARVIKNVTGGAMVVERLLPGLPPGLAPWFIPGEVITCDNSPATTATYSVGDEHAQWVDNAFTHTPFNFEANLATALQDPLFTRHLPGDAATNLWWDRGAKLATSLPVASSAALPGWSRIQGATSGATALVVGVFDATHAAIADVVGTFQNGESLNIVGGAAGATTVTGTYTPTTAGEWVHYTVRPNLAGIGARWDKVPYGSDTSNRQGRVGVEPYVMQKAVESFGATDVFGIKLDVNSPLVKNASGLGGVCYGRIPITTTTPGFTIGETLTSAGSPGWSAVVVAQETLAPPNQNDMVAVWVRSVTGTLAPGTITGGTSGKTAAATDNVWGWMKGAAFYQLWLAEVAAALAKAPGGDTFDWQLLFLDAAEGDCNIPAGTLPNSQHIADAYVALAEALRTDLSAPNLIVVAFRHLQTHHVSTRPGNAFFIRDGILRAAQADRKIRFVSADDFAAAPAATGNIASATEVIWLPVLAYPELGKQVWLAYQGGVLDDVVTDFGVANVVLTLGQSQGAARIPLNFWLLERDPELAKLTLTDAIGAGSTWLSTTEDVQVKQYNAALDQWQVYNVATNGTTFGPGPGYESWSGPEVSTLKRLMDRMRSADPTALVYHIKVPFNASSLQAAAEFAVGTWDGNVVQPVVVTTCNVTASPRRITATAGTPFTLAAGWKANRYVEISGSLVNGGAILGAGGNNTNPAPKCQPTRITAVDAAGAWIEVEGATTAETGVLLTLSLGPVAVRAQAAQVIRNALRNLAVVENKIPRAVAIVIPHGESDVGYSAGYQTALEDLIDWARSVFGHRGPGELACPAVLVKLNENFPSEDTEEIAAIRAAQDAVTQSRQRVALVDPSDLEYEFGSAWLAGGATPQTERGVHMTPRGTIRCGYRVARAFDAFEEIPDDPNPSDPGEGAALDAPVGGAGAEDAGQVDFAGVDDVGVDALVDVPLVVETGAGIVGADSYVDLEYADAYAQKWGNPDAWVNASDAQKQLWLRLAARDDLDGVYGPFLSGYRATEDQGLEYPRRGSGDNQTGRQVASNVVPWWVRDSQCIAALERAAGGVGALATEQPGDAGVTQSTDRSAAGSEESRTYASGKTTQVHNRRVAALMGRGLQDFDRVVRA